MHEPRDTVIRQPNIDDDDDDDDCNDFVVGNDDNDYDNDEYDDNDDNARIAVPRGPVHAKGLLLSSIEEPDPCIILEPKVLYRTAVDEVPIGHYKIDIGKGEIVKEGKDVTLIGWGTQVHVLLDTADLVEEKLGASCEVIDLFSILPWDVQLVCKVNLILLILVSTKFV
ncbi:hypothetical protein M0802_011132 [Mischocyttarus mexicanus]|nr:hypothetical protein M0802_011132 [Mischocyttarus mexicanus]